MDETVGIGTPACKLSVMCTACLYLLCTAYRHNKYGKYDDNEYKKNTTNTDYGYDAKAAVSTDAATSSKAN